MDDNYYGVTSELDAREILRYLNHLGIRNISGEVLKYFITDLKKLIKYDLEQKSESQNERKYNEGPERLHSASTFSSRGRSRGSNRPVCPCSREYKEPRRLLTARNIQSAPNLGHQGQSQGDKPMRRACSCVRIEKKLETVPKESKATVSSNNCKSIIKVPRVPPKKKCDPVSLYHYYTTLWEKYKPNVPGENNWAELRWRIRQKMAGCAPNQAPELPR